MRSEEWRPRCRRGPAGNHDALEPARPQREHLAAPGLACRSGKAPPPSAPRPPRTTIGRGGEGPSSEAGHLWPCPMARAIPRTGDTSTTTTILFAIPRPPYASARGPGARWPRTFETPGRPAPMLWPKRRRDGRRPHAALRSCLSHARALQDAHDPRPADRKVDRDVPSQQRDAPVRGPPSCSRERRPAGTLLHGGIGAGVDQCAYDVLQLVLMTGARQSPNQRRRATGISCLDAGARVQEETHGAGPPARSGERQRRLPVPGLLVHGAPCTQEVLHDTLRPGRGGVHQQRQLSGLTSGTQILGRQASNVADVVGPRREHGFSGELLHGSRLSRRPAETSAVDAAREPAARLPLVRVWPQPLAKRHSSARSTTRVTLASRPGVCRPET